MATDKEFITFLLDTLKPVGNISARPMFGEYGLYYEEKLIGLVCDNQMLIKITPAGWSVLGENAATGEAYPGSKPFFVIDNPEDTELMAELIHKTWQELPFKKSKNNPHNKQ
ncbi:MAG: TfoX/Sxy family protein [Anaerolineaceae bacterium]|jgi:TfoX/Sxy family transcriptional regulator of competence genes